MASLKFRTVGKAGRSRIDGDGIVKTCNMKRLMGDVGRDMNKDAIVRDEDFNPEHYTKRGELQEDKGTKKDFIRKGPGANG